MSLIHVQIDQAGYEQGTHTIQDVNFSIEPAQLVGMIGANGAGKSTTIKAILDELLYIEGTITRKEGLAYSYIPERPVYYDELTLWEHFEFVAAVEGLTEEHLHYAKQLLQMFRLHERIHEFPHTFSKGMQQKGMITLALFSNPDLLIIDEPFMGLDPKSTKLFLQLLDEERQKGTGILMCTHILDTAQRVCDSFIIIENGTVKASGILEDVLQTCGVTDGSLYSCIDEDDADDDK